jgi:hypothetical protein
MRAIGFYPQNPTQLKNMVKGFLKSEKQFTHAKGIVSPHAGYIFSGATAGATFFSAKTEKRSFVIMGPNHTGYGSTASLSNENFDTPLGEAQIDREKIKELSDVFDVDETAHRYEHSLEVQIPFLQVLYKNFRIVPICLQHVNLERLETLAKLFDGSNFYIASSDFIHFGPNYGYVPIDGDIDQQLQWTRKIDHGLISLICSLKPKQFYKEVMKNGYTVCGFVPITLLMFIMKNIGAKKGHLIKYTTSYETHPDSSFVTYAGIVFE